MFYSRPRWAIFQHNSFVEVNKNIALCLFLTHNMLKKGIMVMIFWIYRVPYKKCTRLTYFILLIFTGKHLCWRLFLTKLQSIRPVNLLKETPSRLILCECNKIFKNSFFIEHLWQLHLERPYKILWQELLNSSSRPFYFNKFLWVFEIFCSGAVYPSMVVHHE